MKKLVSTAILLAALSAHAEESSYRLGDPFLLPQTNFVFGKVDYEINFTSSNGDKKREQLNSGTLNTFGFDIEVNSNSFLNIGAFFRIESQSNEANSLAVSQFSALLGGFTRFFYVPPFLRGKSLVTNVFTRLDLGLGPTFLGAINGLIGMGAVHVGFETYVNKWVGVSFSYGRIVEVGKETLLSGTSTSYTEPYRNASIWNQGGIFMLSLKTTFL